MSRIRYSCQILMKLEFSRQNFHKYSNIKFHDNTSSGIPFVPRGRTDRHDEANSRFLKFCESFQKGEFSEGWYLKSRSHAKLSTTLRCHVSGGIAPRSLNLGTRWRKVVNFTSRSAYNRTKSSLCLMNRKLCAPWSLWMFRRKQKSAAPAGNRNKISHPSSL